MALQGIEVEGVIIKEYPAVQAMPGSRRNLSFRRRISILAHVSSVCSVQTVCSSSIFTRATPSISGLTSMPVLGRTAISMISTAISATTLIPMQ